MALVISSFHSFCFQVSPAYDPLGTTALIAANLLFEMLCVLPGVKYHKMLPWNAKMLTAYNYRLFNSRVNFISVQRNDVPGDVCNLRGGGTHGGRRKEWGRFIPEGVTKPALDRTFILFHPREYWNLSEFLLQNCSLITMWRPLFNDINFLLCIRNKIYATFKTLVYVRSTQFHKIPCLLCYYTWQVHSS